MFPYEDILVMSSKLAVNVLHVLFMAQQVLSKMFSDGLRIILFHRAHVLGIVFTLVRKVRPCLRQFS